MGTRRITTGSNVEWAREWWTRYAPGGLQAALDALYLATGDIPDDPETLREMLALYAGTFQGGTPEERNRWLEAGILLFFWAGRYHTMDGRAVPRNRVRGALDAALERTQSEMQALCQEMRTGRIGLGEWQQSMADTIAVTHIVSAALQQGGFMAMSADAWSTAQSGIETQLSYLEALTGRIESGEQRLDGTLCRNMQMYLQSARGTYHAVEEQWYAGQGAVYYSNVLTARESCEGCIEEANKGIVLIGELSPIGTRTCLSNCRCYYQYYNENKEPI